MTGWVGRIRQTIQFITAWIRPVRDSKAREYLTKAEYLLFLKMSRAERQHHLRVLNFLLKADHNHPSLLKAALLHDVGKTRFRFTLPERVLVVIVKTLSPQKFEQWSQSAPQGWKRPFVISACHPVWSAEMGAAEGLDELALDLITRHQSPVPDPPQTEADQLLILLQTADNQS